jgi:hypothetical protein
VFKSLTKVTLFRREFCERKRDLMKILSLIVASTENLASHLTILSVATVSSNMGTNTRFPNCHRCLMLTLVDVSLVEIITIPSSPY